MSKKNNPMTDLLERFLKYVSIDTQSDGLAERQPSTAKQFDLLKLLQIELSAMGIENTLDEHGYLYASIPANSAKEFPKIGFIAHVDTSPDVSGKDIRPVVWRNYDGEDLLINPERNIFLKTSEYPEIRNYVGQTIITTDGTTLLGADDKAGVAAIMQMAEFITENPAFEHGEIKIAFTPDEEIGRGTENFNLGKFGAEYAYTIDGGEIGELEYECFNAASAKITIAGKNMHPGYAKGKMVNSILVAEEFDSLLPENERPENTEGYDGFFHLTDFHGTVEHTTLQYIVRDHSNEKFRHRKQKLLEVTELMNNKYGNIVYTEICDSYRNMREYIEHNFEVVEWALEAMKKSGIVPKVQPIRGGTDGASLSAKGLPCPNIFAGGHNFHSRFEYVPLESIEKAKEVMLNIIQASYRSSKSSPK